MGHLLLKGLRQELPPMTQNTAPFSNRGTTLATEVRGTILLVDDEEQIRRLVSVALGRVNYDVILASTGQEALASIAEAIPDLIVLDVMMPGMDGLTLLGQLRTDPGTRAIPIIMLTAKGTTDDIVAGLDLGADDYLSKPFAMSELVARVRAKMERPSIPYDELPHDRQTGLLTERPFIEELKREVARAARNGATGCLAYLSLNELPHLMERMGTRIEMEVARQVAELLLDDSRPFDVVGRDASGTFLLLLPETGVDDARR